eukprot:GHVH01009239.1.p1 GENE.GHVH01009239.1~~GHVH01009239.1.p1  ORF type:complete len:1192 (+),score=182.74 GHVH01009239.1:748-4323(+)
MLAMREARHGHLALCENDTPVEPDITEIEIESLVASSPRRALCNAIPTMNPFYEGKLDREVVRKDKRPIEEDSANFTNTPERDGSVDSSRSLSSDRCLPSTRGDCQLPPPTSDTTLICAGGVLDEVTQRCASWWQNLRILNLSRIPVARLIELQHASSFRDLQELSLVRCGLSEAPSCLESCHRLVKLDLSHNSITRIAWLSSLKALTTLTLSSNMLTCFPFDGMVKPHHQMKYLDISDNPRLTEPPPANYPIRFPSLKILNMTSTPVSVLPTSWHNFKRLATLSLDWFHYTCPSLPIHLTGVSLALLLSILRTLSNDMPFVGGLDLIRTLTDHLNPNEKKGSAVHSLSICKKRRLVVDISRNVSKQFEFPLHYAVEQMDLGVIQLITDSEEHNYMIHTRDRDGETPLSLSVRDGRVEVVKMLIRAGGDDFEGPLVPLVHTSVSNLDIKVLNELILGGANVHSRDKRGNGLWHVLVTHFDSESGGQEVARVLSTHKVDPSVVNHRHWSPIHLSVSCGDSCVLRWILYICRRWTLMMNVPEGISMMNVNQRGGDENSTLLHLVSYYQRIEELKALLDDEYLIDPTAVNRHGLSAHEVTSSHTAVRQLCRKAEIIRYLMDVETSYRKENWFIDSNSVVFPRRIRTCGEMLRCIKVASRSDESSIECFWGALRKVSVKEDNRVRQPRDASVSLEASISIEDFVWRQKGDGQYESVEVDSIEEEEEEEEEEDEEEDEDEEGGDEEGRGDDEAFDDIFGHRVSIDDMQSTPSPSLSRYRFDHAGGSVSYHRPPKLFTRAFGLDNIDDPMTNYNLKRNRRQVDFIDPANRLFEEDKKFINEGKRLLVKTETARYRTSYFQQASMKASSFIGGNDVGEMADELRHKFITVLHRAKRSKPNPLAFHFPATSISGAVCDASNEGRWMSELILCSLVTQCSILELLTKVQDELLLARGLPYHPLVIVCLILSIARGGSKPVYDSKSGKWIIVWLIGKDKDMMMRATAHSSLRQHPKETPPKSRVSLSAAINHESSEDDPQTVLKRRSSSGLFGTCLDGATNPSGHDVSNLLVQCRVQKEEIKQDELGVQTRPFLSKAHAFSPGSNRKKLKDNGLNNAVCYSCRNPVLAERPAECSTCSMLPCDRCVLAWLLKLEVKVEKKRSSGKVQMCLPRFFVRDTKEICVCSKIWTIVYQALLLIRSS